MRRVVFDLETEPFTAAFKEATTGAGRLGHAPSLRLACAYVEDLDEYRFYAPGEAGELIRLLETAGEVVSFNGERFDLLVLRRHHGLTDPVPKEGGDHVDLCKLLSERAGFNVGLNMLAKMNLGEGKHTKGREMEALDLEGLKEACRSDVEQTYRLWRLWRDGKIRLPAGSGSRRGRPDPDEYLGPGPGEHMPLACPNCGAVGALEFLEDPDADEMSDGQLADYEAGLWGSAACLRCGTVTDYGF